MTFGGKNIQFISLNQASDISGYASDYIGYLIRQGELKGRKIKAQAHWETTIGEIKRYYKESNGFDLGIKDKDSKRVSLKQASLISGYAPDYIGYLLRKGKIKGKRIFEKTFWQVSKKDLLSYCAKNREQIIEDEPSLAPLRERQVSQELILDSSLKIKKADFFAAGKRLVLATLLALILFFGTLPSGSMLAMMKAWAGEEDVVNFYSFTVEGNWQNLQNAKGLPQGPSSAGISAF